MAVPRIIEGEQLVGKHDLLQLAQEDHLASGPDQLRTQPKFKRQHFPTLWGGPQAGLGKHRGGPNRYDW
ncbi:MAG: hypothetical protein NTY06_01255 [Candidatus Gottesmanbacteria bacterium]|nr:hypothetical protein [Candidatus Gottesmanbacteria bacterium]